MKLKVSKISKAQLLEAQWYLHYKASQLVSDLLSLFLHYSIYCTVLVTDNVTIILYRLTVLYKWHI